MKTILWTVCCSIVLCISQIEASSLKHTPKQNDLLKKEIALIKNKVEVSESELRQSLLKMEKIISELKTELETLKRQKSFENQEIKNQLEDLKELKHILIKYGNNSDGMTAMHYAIKVGDLNAVRFLIENGADANSKDGKFTALTRAAAYNQYEIAKFLLSFGVDVNLIAEERQYPYQCTPYALNYAAESGSTELVNLLIDYGAILDISRPDDDSGYPKGPLHTAAKAGNYEAVVALVKAGAKIDGICPHKIHHDGNNNNMTPLSVASIELKYIDNPQHLDLIKFLVENGATRRFFQYYKGFTCKGCVNCPIISEYLQSVEKR